MKADFVLCMNIFLYECTCTCTCLWCCYNAHAYLYALDHDEDQIVAKRFNFIKMCQKNSTSVILANTDWIWYICFSYCCLDQWPTGPAEDGSIFCLTPATRKQHGSHFCLVGVSKRTNAVLQESWLSRLDHLGLGSSSVKSLRCLWSHCEMTCCIIGLRGTCLCFIR